MDFKVLIFTLT